MLQFLSAEEETENARSSQVPSWAVGWMDGVLQHFSYGIIRITLPAVCSVAKSCPTHCAPWTVADRLLCPWDSPGQEYCSGWPSPSPGVFPTQGWGSLVSYLLRWQAGSLPSAACCRGARGKEPTPLPSPSPVGRLFTTVPPRKPVSSPYTETLSLGRQGDCLKVI